MLRHRFVTKRELISGHTSHSELVDFLRRAKAALRDEESLIIVKENTCEDGPDGLAKEFLDEEDSSLTRYVFVVLLLRIILPPCHLRSSSSISPFSITPLELSINSRYLYCSFALPAQWSVEPMYRLWLNAREATDDRSNGKWLEVFNDAGLKLVKEEVQVGMPEELFVVKT